MGRAMALADASKPYRLPPILKKEPAELAVDAAASNPPANPPSQRPEQDSPVKTATLPPASSPPTPYSDEAMRRYDINVPPTPYSKCDPISIELKGNNVVACGSQLLLGGDRYNIFISLVLMTVPTACFVVPASQWDTSFAIVIPPVVLWIIMVATSCAAAFLDPGIIPRKPPPPPGQEVKQGASKLVDGVIFKWCRTCNIYRPPRCKHCPVCDNCVDRFDHHCPWVGTCIGRRNYRYFFIFINATCISALYVAVVSLVYLLQEHSSFSDAMADSWHIAIAFVLSSLAAPLVGSLAGYHMILIYENKTTNEDLNRVYEAAPNPFQMGCTGNIQALFCATQRPSLLVVNAQKDGDSKMSREAWVSPNQPGVTGDAASPAQELNTLPGDASSSSQEGSYPGSIPSIPTLR